MCRSSVVRSLFKVCLCECPEEMGRTACGSLNVLHSQFLSVLSVFKSLKFKGRMLEVSLGVIVNPLYSSRSIVVLIFLSE